MSPWGALRAALWPALARLGAGRDPSREDGAEVVEAFDAVENDQPGVRQRLEDGRLGVALPEDPETRLGAALMRKSRAVDLTAELVTMITAQRIYQANAQTIKTQDQILQTLVNLK